LSHGKNSVHLFAFNLRNLMFWHVFDVVVILDESIGIDTFVVSGSKPASENSRVFFIEKDENTS